MLQRSVSLELFTIPLQMFFFVVMSYRTNVKFKMIEMKMFHCGVIFIFVDKTGILSESYTQQGSVHKSVITHH